jgi:hypothetical protein
MKCCNNLLSKIFNKPNKFKWFKIKNVDIKLSTIANDNIKENIDDNKLRELKLLENLKTISDIDVNQRLYLENDILTIDDSWFQSISRWYWEQNHIKHINYIRHMISLSLNYKDRSDVKLLLQKCKTYGLVNYRKTYENCIDDDCRYRFDNLAELLNKI